eukprot:TsM_000463900 transcript=TsM_000463900 gene=TsM_000463900
MLHSINSSLEVISTSNQLLFDRFRYCEPLWRCNLFRNQAKDLMPEDSASLIPRCVPLRRTRKLNSPDYFHRLRYWLRKKED